MQPLNHLFHMFLVSVPHAPLIARLRPATDLYAMYFLSAHLLGVNGLPEPEHKDPGGARIGQNRGVSGILFIQLFQLIKVWLIIDIHPVLANGCAELKRLEEFIRTETCEDGDAVRRRIDFPGGISENTIHVLIETLSFRRTGRPCPRRDL